MLGWLIRRHAASALHQLLLGSLAGDSTVAAHFAEIDDATGLSMLQLAQHELQHHPSSAAADVAALLQAEQRIWHAHTRQQVTRALKQAGLSSSTGSIVLAFIDGGQA